MRFEFIVPGVPVPWQRAGYRRSSAHFYTPRETRKYQLKVRAAASTAGVIPLAAPVALELRIYLPDAHTRDGDNIEKSIADALQQNIRRKWRALAFENDTAVRDVLRSTRLDQDNPRVEVVLLGELLGNGTAHQASPKSRKLPSGYVLRPSLIRPR